MKRTVLFAMAALLLGGCTAINKVFFDDDFVDGNNALQRGDNVTAAAHFKVACDERKDKGSCYNLSYIYYSSKDYPNAIIYAHKACDVRNPKGCHAIGYMYEVGEGLEQSYPEAISYYNKGCGLEMDKACEDVLKLYAKMAHMYESGEGFAQSYSEAASYYDKACEGGIYESCQSLSNLYVKGLGVKQNLPKAQSLIERSCTATDNGGECYQFAVAFLDVGDRAKAEQFFTLGCDKNHMNSCRELVNIYARGRQKDYFKASTYLEKVCNSGDENSCYELALIYADKKSGMSDMEEAKRYFGKACTFGSKDGCSAEKKIVIEPKKDIRAEAKKR